MMRQVTGQMSRADRFFAAVRLEQADRVPLFDFLFQQPLYEAMIGRRPEAYNARDAVECALALDNDGVWVPFGAFSGFRPERLAEDVYVDEWGVTYQNTPSSWPIDAPVSHPIKTRADLVGYRPPDPTLPGRTAEIDAAVAMDNGGIAIIGGVSGPFTNTWLLMGYEQICYALYDDPELLVELFQINNEYNMEAARLSVEAGCQAIFISDDLGDSSRGFMRLPHFRKYLLPSLVELAEYIDGLGVPVLLHSCGHVASYLDDLAQTKIAAIHPLQRTAGMDLRAVKEGYGDRFCIIGNVDSSRTLPFGTVEDVEAETRDAIDIAAPGGGFILASDHSLHDGIPIENILAMFRVGDEYGRAFYSREA